MATFLETYRRQTGLSQAELAAAAVVARSTIVDLEREPATGRGSLRTRVQIASALGDCLDWTQDDVSAAAQRLTDADPAHDQDLTTAMRLLGWLPLVDADPKRFAADPASSLWHALGELLVPDLPPHRAAARVHSTLWRVWSDHQRDAGARARGVVEAVRPILALIQPADSAFVDAVQALTAWSTPREACWRWADDLYGAAWAVWSTHQAGFPTSVSAWTCYGPAWRSYLTAAEFYENHPAAADGWPDTKVVRGHDVGGVTVAHAARAAAGPLVVWDARATAESDGVHVLAEHATIAQAEDWILTG